MTHRWTYVIELDCLQLDVPPANEEDAFELNSADRLSTPIKAAAHDGDIATCQRDSSRKAEPEVPSTLRTPVTVCAPSPAWHPEDGVEPVSAFQTPQKSASARLDPLSTPVLTPVHAKMQAAALASQGSGARMQALHRTEAQPINACAAQATEAAPVAEAQGARSRPSTGHNHGTAGSSVHSTDNAGAQRGDAQASGTPRAWLWLRNMMLGPLHVVRRQRAQVVP